MKIAIRMDDVTPYMDWKRFDACKALLDRYGIRPLIGVVPDNGDDGLNLDDTDRRCQTFWSYVRELQKQGWVVAMHGCRHIYTTQKGGVFPLNDFSEFAGLPYEVQKGLISEGRHILQSNGIQTDIFMAPAHSYDHDTLKALRETGFRRITDGFGRQPYQWKGMIFYPISYRLHSSLNSKKGTSTMVLHTNTMSETEIRQLGDYLEHPGQTQWISYDEYLRQDHVTRQPIARLEEYWRAKIKFLLVKLKGAL